MAVTGGKDRVFCVYFRGKQTPKESHRVRTSEKIGTTPPSECAGAGDINSAPVTLSREAMEGYETRDSQYYKFNEVKDAGPHNVTRCFRGLGLENQRFVGSLLEEEDVLRYPPVGVQGKDRKNFAGGRRELEEQRRYKGVPVERVVLEKKRLGPCRVSRVRHV